MDSPQAAWVDMLMKRLHTLECKVDVLDKRNDGLQAELEARAPKFAPGFNGAADYFFYASADWKPDIAAWSAMFGKTFRNFTICRIVVGERIDPPPRHPLVTIVGVLRQTKAMSCAEVSHLIHACMGQARGCGVGLPYANVESIRTGDVCEAVIARCEHSAHRDPDNDSAGGETEYPDLDFLLHYEKAHEFWGQLKAFMASDHIHDHFTNDEGGRSALLDIEEALLTP